MILFGKNKKAKNHDQNLKQFEEQISLIYKELYKFIYSITRDKTIAEDCLQNTLLIAYKNYESLKFQDKFKPWIFTIARREAIKLIRKNTREFPEEDEILQLVINKDQGFEIPEKIILMKELSKIVFEGLSKLKPEYKDIMNLRYYHNMTFEEIAEVLNLNVNTVRTRHRRAKERIYEFLMENYFESDEIKKENV